MSARAALMVTFAAAAEEGIESFSMIHDSFGTVATDASLLARILREQFMRFHRRDIIGELRAQFSK